MSKRIVRITEIGEHDAHYDSRQYLIGATGILVMEKVSPRGNDWKVVALLQCNYDDCFIDDEGRRGGFGQNGDMLMLLQAKFEDVEDET